ncbi:MAG TPA: putative Ig domain-containing protein, partial [Chitinophaga sp.]|uniref:fibronectin type III domain-containing protein n=1 Tax=Chitinophaga sp. TaxID=1869181 RepID=UPI002DB9A0C9
ATATASDKINLTWKDNSTNETGFEVYRSANNNANYVLIATVGANSTTQATFADSALFANAKYYYQVRAKNDGGVSAYSNEAFTTTLNNLPEIAGLSDRTMRYGTQISYNITASDPDDEPVSITTANTPAFTSISANGQSGITMTFSPASPANIGVYNIQVTATDQHGGVTNSTFKLTVDDNYQPSLTTINDVSLAEKTTAQFTVQASDQNATDTTIWTVTGLPAFATLTTSGRTGQVVLAPGYADAGTYPVTVNISDNKGGTDTKSFTINVTDINPNYSVDINFTEGSYQAAAPWYNTNKRPVLNDVFTNIKDLSGNNTGMAFTILTPWQNINGGVNTNNQGYTTGNNSGIYPDNAMTSNWWTQNAKQTMRFTGLKPGFKYSFTMFGSRYGISDTRAATYTINGASVTLNGTNNINQTVTINNVRADSAGGVTFDIQPAAGSQYAYINTLVIDAVYDDSTAPAKPGHFAARTLTQGVRLSWTDQAYNENAYELYRASSQAGPYTLLATRPANDTAYTDLGATSGNTWYYLARAINDYGASPFTDTTSILVPNQPPVLAAIANVIMKSDTTTQIAVSATDAPDDVITLSASGFPAFATLTNTGNGTANLNLAPATSDIGKYTLKVIATDSRGDTSSRTFTVQVTDKKVTSIYVNCNQVEPASAPWNNFNAVPNANAGISNLQDEAGNASGISITVLDAMTGANNVGAVTGDNSGVYPDAVMKTFFYDQSGAEKRVRISGLSASRKYNLVFFGSRTGVTDNRNTIYAANGQSVTLNAASNVSNTVQLNGLTPDGSGNIIFTVKQASGSFSAYLNALVIQSYVDDGKPLSPANLVAAPGTRTSITLNWADKSNNETGFEVYRSASRNGTYTLLGTVATNVTTYKDSSLTANSVYYYKVRAKAGTLYSDYSNIATGGTLAYGLYVNFTTTTIAPAPWNNTAALPYEGLTLGNLQDDGGNTTSVSMTIVSNFTGTNPAGVQTGDNSGVYPDKVMAESYYTETDTARMKISGLDQAKQYSFTFFGSRASGGTRITAYAIGTKVVTLDANDNRSNTVTIENVKPDGNGEIIITVYTALNYGYLNAMVINAFPPEDSSGLQSLPNYGGGVMSNVRTTNIGVMGALAPTVQPATVQQHNDDGVDGITVENAYPNPFSSYINLSIRQQQEARILIRLLDGNGRLILVKDLGKRSSGVYQERIDVGNRVLGNGLYLLQILSESKPVKTIKLIRN